MHHAYHEHPKPDHETANGGAHGAANGTANGAANGAANGVAGEFPTPSGAKHGVSEEVVPTALQSEIPLDQFTVPRLWYELKVRARPARAPAPCAQPPAARRALMCAVSHELGARRWCPEAASRAACARAQAAPSAPAGHRPAAARRRGARARRQDACQYEARLAEVEAFNRDNLWRKRGISMTTCRFVMTVGAKPATVHVYHGAPPPRPARRAGAQGAAPGRGPSGAQPPALPAGCHA